MAEPDVQRLLDLHKSLVFNEETQKIKCSLTSHEMPAKASAIESYVSGKKYKRLAGLNSFAYEDHKEHIVQNKKKENELFCNLTLRHLEKTAKAIQRHINGRKYKNALTRWKECQKTGTKFTPNNQRKAKGPKQSEDDDVDNDDDKADKKGGDDDDDDVASDGTVIEDESTDDEEDGDDVDDDDDDMSDLYPAADFKELSDENEEEKENEEDVEDEEDEDEEEEEDNSKNKKANGGKKTKRSKVMNGHGPGKKKKIKLHKT